jgi:hypothetical protein
MVFVTVLDLVRRNLGMEIGAQKEKLGLHKQICNLSILKRLKREKWDNVWCYWLTPVILATQEAEMRSWFKASPGK